MHSLYNSARVPGDGEGNPRYDVTGEAGWHHMTEGQGANMADAGGERTPLLVNTSENPPPAVPPPAYYASNNSEGEGKCWDALFQQFML